MRNKIFFISSLLLLSFSGLAQVILTKDAVPKIGEKFYFSTSSFLKEVAFSLSGNNNIWDFTQLPRQYKYRDTISILDPATSFGHDSFPNATFAIRTTRKSGLPDYYSEFYYVNDSGLYGLGSYFDDIGMLVTTRYSPHSPELQFPVKLGNYRKNKFEFITPGIPVNKPGDSVKCVEFVTYIDDVLAEGVLKLSDASYPAILMKRTTVDTFTCYARNDTSNGQWVFDHADSLTIIKYYWFVQNSTIPYLEYRPRSPLNPNYDMVNYEGKYSGLSKIDLLNQIFLYPNPANQSVTFDLNKFGEAVYYSIKDINGMVLQNGLINHKDSMINISSLSKGFYFVQLKTIYDESKLLKLIKE